MSETACNFTEANLLLASLIYFEFFKSCLQINTCNGFYCDYFSPNRVYKPTLWTEAWTGW